MAMLMLMTFESNWMPSSKSQRRGFKNTMKGWINFFQRGQMQNVEQRCRFLGKLRPKIRKFCVVKTYTDIEEVVVATAKIERVLGELGETPYEPMKEEQDETMSGESTTDRHLHVLNETLINFFGKGTNGKAGPSIGFLLTLTTIAYYAIQKNT
jgi:hypothetical protein